MAGTLITNYVQGLLYQGAPLDLREALFLPSVQSICTASDNGKGFKTITAATQFSGELRDGQVYFFISKTLGYTVPTSAPVAVPTPAPVLSSSADAFAI